ncbi:MAG: hypothetical protein ACLVAW_29725 [Eisenbergiella massiliensis]
MLEGDFICFRVFCEDFAAGCVLLLVVMCLVSVLVAGLLTRFLTRKPVVEQLRGGIRKEWRILVVEDDEILEIAFALTREGTR